MAKREIWGTPEYDQQDIRSIQALARYAQQTERPLEPGQEPPPVPTPYDVKRALDWIVHKAAMTYENPTLISLMAGDTSGDLAPFIDGRRFVGRELVKLITLKASILERNKDGSLSESQ